MYSIHHRNNRAFFSTTAVLLLAAVLPVQANHFGGSPPPLSQVPVPQPTGGDIINQTAAIRLGKALFWDIQVGGDGQTACASCHFVAGVDNRRRNTIHPGPNGVFQAVNGPGQLFNGATLPTNVDDIVGSQGVANAFFQAIHSDPSVSADTCAPVASAVFGNHRQVTGRNTPSVIGAVFFRDSFWDGRANHHFNGLDPFGQTANAGGALTAIKSASAASQAVGPPNNAVEMACAERTFNGANSLATKVMARPPLQFQQVSPSDSVLGSLSAAPVNGLRCGTSTCSYPQMIQAAFGPALAANAQAQFSRLWGQAIQAYVATLIPSGTPFDRFLTGNTSAMTAQQRHGWNLFFGRGNCLLCHAGSELSDASMSLFAETGGFGSFSGGDQGFHNTGVRPTNEDLGRAALGPNGVTFSVSSSPSDRGAFKTPSLRNVKLTAPYFHNGGKATLANVVDFYNRGGDFNNPEKNFLIRPLFLNAGDRAALVDFLTNALTDCRTEKERAPFDHPSLPIPNGSNLPAVGAAGTGSCS